LVIKNEADMGMIIKFLVYSLRTINGDRNTASGVLNILLRQQIQELRSKKRLVSKIKETQIA
jgi:hypothetical protein